MTSSEVKAANSETWKHIYRVQQLLSRAIVNLLGRSESHDQSKLKSPEAEIFAEFTEKLKGSTYGSDEYQGFLKQMKPALEHHYGYNSHHPEHYPEGINQMSLLDLLEMLLDWKAASERHDDGSIVRSVEMNQDRLG